MDSAQLTSCSGSSLFFKRGYRSLKTLVNMQTTVLEIVVYNKCLFVCLI